MDHGERVRMGRALCRRHAAAVVTVTAGLLGLWGPGPAPAWAEEVPLDDLLVAPPAATLEVITSGADEYDGLSFIENYERDITVVAEARGAVRQDGSPRLLVTVVRLASPAEAADALAAIGEPVSAEDMGSTPEMDAFGAELDLPDPSIEALPPPRRDVVARRIVLTEDRGIVEMAWATGRDVVVLADLGPEETGDAPSPIMHATLDAHRAAFPDVTMPAGARAMPSWRMIGVGAAVLAVVVRVLAQARRGRSMPSSVRPSATPVPQARGGDGPPRARANW